MLRQFQLMGMATPSDAEAIARARDKLRCHQLLAAEVSALPDTVFGDNPDDTADLLALLGPPPHVIKLNEGTQGAGVMLTEKPSASRGAVETLRGLYANFLVQEFIAEARGADLRCFVVGDRVVAAMRRQAPKGEFVPTCIAGNPPNRCASPAPRRRPPCAQRAVLGLGVAGVDMLRSKRGPLVLEVNSSPGLGASRPRPAWMSPAASCRTWSGWRVGQRRSNADLTVLIAVAHDRVMAAMSTFPGHRLGRATSDHPA